MFLFQIGCFPGFEDGEFESAKMLRPAATLYDEEEDCLYIVDSEVLWLLQEVVITEYIHVKIVF